MHKRIHVLLSLSAKIAEEEFSTDVHVFLNKTKPWHAFNYKTNLCFMYRAAQRIHLTRL